MDTLYPLIAFLVGGALGAFVLWRIQKEKVDRAERRAGEVEAELKRTTEEIGALKVQVGKLEERGGQVEALTKQLEDSRTEAGSYREKYGRLEAALAASRQQLEEERALLSQAQQKLENVFKAASADALKEAQTQFLEVADQVLKKHTTAVEADLEKRQQAIDGMVKPIRESLEKVDTQVAKLDKEFSTRAAETSKHVDLLLSGLREQQQTTENLKSILRGPTTRGRAGEMFLKRILEHAGLEERIHFDLQVSETLEGGRSRPDCIVHLPSGKALVIDAKTPLNAYEESVNLEDEAAKAAKLREHAANVRKEIDRLARRPYTDLAKEAELVMMYLPIEASFSAAVMQDPEIVNYGWDRRVILVGPTTLFVVLQTVALDWRQDKLRQNAQEISDVGREMVDRIRVVAVKVTQLGKDLKKAAASYDEAVGSIQRNLIVTAHKFQRLGAGKATLIPQPSPIGADVREFTKPELLSLPPDDVVEALEASSQSMEDVLESESLSETGSPDGGADSVPESVEPDPEEPIP